MMSRDDLGAVQDASRKLIEREGTVRILVILKDYQGFAKDADWGDIGFAVEYGDRIERMAIVGDTKWKREPLPFPAREPALPRSSTSRLASSAKRRPGCSVPEHPQFIGSFNMKRITVLLLMLGGMAALTGVANAYYESFSLAEDSGGQDGRPGKTHDGTEETEHSRGIKGLA